MMASLKESYRRYPRLRVYTFRAWVDERGWNMDREHAAHFGQYYAAGDHCGCYRLWDLNRKGSSHNILRIVRGKRTFKVSFGKKFRTIGWGSYAKGRKY